MDPAVVVALVGAAALFGAGVWVGWSLVNDRLAGVEGELSRVVGERDLLRAREQKRALGAEVDLGRAEALARAGAAGDRDGVLRAFPDAASSPPGEPDRVADAPGGAGHG